MYQSELTIGTQPEFFASLASHRDKVAVVCGDVRLTYAEWNELVGLIKGGKSSRGVTLSCAAPL